MNILYTIQLEPSKNHKCIHNRQGSRTIKQRITLLCKGKGRSTQRYMCLGKE